MKRSGRSKTVPICMVVVLTSTFLGASSADSAPANSWRELYTAVGKCIQTPTSAIGSEITVVFSIKRDGSLLGKPRISYAKLLGDTNTQKRFVADIFAALGKCFPLNITKGLGGAVAGRPLSFRIVARPPEIST
jgi:hypothetical protein